MMQLRWLNTYKTIPADPRIVHKAKVLQFREERFEDYEARTGQYWSDWKDVPTAEADLGTK